MTGNTTAKGDDETNNNHTIENDVAENRTRTGNGRSVTDDMPPNSNPLQCRYCNKIFKRPSYRKEHERIHTGEKHFSCNFCSQRFNNLTNCRKHESMHVEKMLDCDHCAKSLKILLRTHSGEKPYSCDLCGRSFGFETVLKKHLLFHAGNKPYRCTFCQKSYFTAYSLRVHIRGHTGERTYKCRHCNLAFVTGRRRNKHEKTHQRKNTFECKKCGRVFSTANALTHHHIKSIKNQMIGDCDPSEPEIVYDNDALMIQNGAANGEMLEGNILHHNNYMGSPGKELYNTEIDIGILAETVGGNLTGIGSKVYTTDVYPTALVRSTEHVLKTEPMSNFNIQNNQATICSTYLRDSNFNRENSFQIDAQSKYQLDATLWSNSRYDSQQETESNSFSEQSVVVSDHKSSQTDAMREVDLMFSEMAAARTIHECKLCGIIYRDYTMFLLHKTLHINPHKPFMCHLCDQESRDRVEFHSHLIWHMK